MYVNDIKSHAKKFKSQIKYLIKKYIYKPRNKKKRGEEEGGGGKKVECDSALEKFRGIKKIKLGRSETLFGKRNGKKVKYTNSENEFRLTVSQGSME